MLDEVAAISCEPNAEKQDRIALFAQLLEQGRTIPWEGFLQAGHPLKTEAARKLLLGVGKRDRGAVAFDVAPGSSYEREIALFYSQAAAFGEFMKARSCVGAGAIGRLLTTYDPREGFDRWLHGNATGLCLPGSVKEFGNSFDQFIRHKRVLEGRDHPRRRL
jgi:hypothetical protein